MKLDFFHTDAFTGGLFAGNPAAIVVCGCELPERTMLDIAREFNLPETAFIRRTGDGNRFSIRCFTPDIEMDLCGHATLSATHVIFTELGYPGSEIHFSTAAGPIVGLRSAEGNVLDFPLREGRKAELPDSIRRSLSKEPAEVWKARDYMLVYEGQEDVENIRIDRPLFDRLNLDPGGVAVTAPGRDCDFVSRFFTPQATIFEDPVTGSAHCTLAPYWTSKLGKTTLSALQLSPRGGRLRCTVDQAAQRVRIEGEAVTFAKGTININL